MKKRSYSFPNMKVVKLTFRDGACLSTSLLYGAIGEAGLYNEDDDIIYDPDVILF